MLRKLHVYMYCMKLKKYVPNDVEKNMYQMMLHK